jgi:hypothetical protein
MPSAIVYDTSSFMFCKQGLEGFCLFFGKKHNPWNLFEEGSSNNSKHNKFQIKEVSKMEKRMVGGMMGVMVGLLILGLFPGWAGASVVGQWHVEGLMTVTVSLQGYGSNSASARFVDYFAFYTDGSFGMIDAHGAWTQSGKKFSVNLDPYALSRYFSEGLYASVGNTRVTVTKAVISGSENRSGNAIRGQIAITTDIYLYAHSVNGKIRVTGNFVGYQAGYAFDSEPGSETKSFKDALAEALNSLEDED